MTHSISGNTCSICWEQLGSHGGVLALPCGHPYCIDCITTQRTINHRCPLCQTDHPTLDDESSDAPALYRPHERAARPRPTHGQGAGSGSFLSDPSRFLSNVAERLSSYAEALPDAATASHRDETGSRFFLPDFLRILSDLVLRLPAYLEALPDTASANVVTEVQRDIESLVARIVLVRFYPPSWEGQISELWDASRQLDETTGHTPADQWHVIAKVHAYTAGVTADFAEFTERRRQRSSQQYTQQQVQQQQQQGHIRLPAHRHGLEPVLEPVQEMVQLMEQLRRQA